MAITRRAQASDNVSNGGIVVSVGLIVALAAIIACLMWVKRRIRNVIPISAPLEHLSSNEVQPRKGIESYMLESIPVIMYRASLESDDQDELSKAGKSTSAGPGYDPVEAAVTAQAEVAQGESPVRNLNVSIKNIDTSINEDTAQAVERKGSRQDTKTCSICTEDFVEGRNVRILPCRHIYHRRCIDPWLLDFAGTCPLWYVDLVIMN